MDDMIYQILAFQDVQKDLETILEFRTIVVDFYRMFIICIISP